MANYASIQTGNLRVEAGQKNSRSTSDSLYSFLLKRQENNQSDMKKGVFRLCKYSRATMRVQLYTYAKYI